MRRFFYENNNILYLLNLVVNKLNNFSKQIVLNNDKDLEVILTILWRYELMFAESIKKYDNLLNLDKRKWKRKWKILK